MPDKKIVYRLLQLTRAIACVPADELDEHSKPHTGNHLFSLINAIDKEYGIYLKTEDYRGARDFTALAEMVQRAQEAERKSNQPQRKLIKRRIH